MNARRFDALVIGSGPVGSVAATVLARGGARVALVDKARFPRDKACGDLVGPRGVQLLDDLGIRVPGAVPVGDMVVVGPGVRRRPLRSSLDRCNKLRMHFLSVTRVRPGPRESPNALVVPSRANLAGGFVSWRSRRPCRYCHRARGTHQRTRPSCTPSRARSSRASCTRL